MTDHEPTKQQIRARQHAIGETYTQARRLLTTATTTTTLTVQSVGYRLSTSPPTDPDPAVMAAPEAVLAAVVANSAQTLTRHSNGETYPAHADVAVLRPQAPARQGATGWYPVHALVVVRARRPWAEPNEDEYEHVTTDTYQAAHDTVLRMWPGLPDQWRPAAMNLTTLAAPMGWTDDDIRRPDPGPTGPLHRRRCRPVTAPGPRRGLTGTAPPGAGKPSRYVHADMATKEKALALTAPVTARPGRCQPSDKVLAFLDRLCGR
ncbi:hypothetical protein [Kitasatospora sp. NPDC051705]|uniref:hypothetical protein n=1 Tax=Kitasatospora sp. NPDC051705 TaxID=3364057 RepID=UPI0037A4B955